MKNLLLLHHFEPFWENQLNSMGTDFESERLKVMDFIEHTELDKVIVTQFEDVKPDHQHAPIIELCREHNIDIEFYTYAYGFEFDENECKDYLENKTWCYGARDYHTNDDVLIIESWMRDLKNTYDNVYLGGAFEDECILDMTTILDALKIEHEKVEGLVVGDNCDYQYKGLNLEDYLENIEEHINDIDNYLNLIGLDDLSDLSDLTDEDKLHIKDKLLSAQERLLEIHEVDKELYSYQVKETVYSSFDEINDFIQEMVDDGESNLISLFQPKPKRKSKLSL